MRFLEFIPHLRLTAPVLIRLGEDKPPAECTTEPQVPRKILEALGLHA